ncbi:hypothetical protein [Streptomyces parvus]|uniref:hypothetical protein n=1 Tax=Streptomyces parvus TaxID=66428 RepID=UPI003811A975
MPPPYRRALARALALTLAVATLTGTGPAHDNNWAPITIDPDGTAYAGVFNGIVAVRDTA